MIPAEVDEEGKEYKLQHMPQYIRKEHLGVRLISLFRAIKWFYKQLFWI